MKTIALVLAWGSMSCTVARDVLTFEPDGGAAAPCPTCDSGLLARWRFDEASGTTAAEDIAGHDGTLTGAVTFVPDGVRDGAIQLQGGYVRAGWDLTAQLDSALTIAEWVNSTATNDKFDRYFSSYWWDTISYGSIELDNDQGSGLRCLLYINNNWSTVWSSLPVTPATWQHIACVYDGSQLSVYVNGNVGASTSVTGKIGTTEVLPIAIGASADSSTGEQAQFEGLIDDLRIYGRGLSPSELAALASGS